MDNRKTKIICTIGPASLPKIPQLLAAGMDCARINTAHGDFDEYSAAIKELRKAGDIPIILDIKGPEIRTRLAKPINAKAGETVDFTFKEGSERSFSYDFSGEIEKGTKVLIDNGKITTEAVKVEEGRVTLAFRSDSRVDNNKGVNLPNTRLNVPPLSEKDRKAIAFGVGNSLDFIALSFVRDANDVQRVRELAGQRMQIIAKIENSEGVEKIGEIISAADGVMVARGDLGVEMPSQKIPLIQKSIIRRCNLAAKPVITATQMLESMIENPFPTRAETSDVANAIIDGSDAVMLSGETAIGKHPVESVEEMGKIAAETEPAVKTTLGSEARKGISGSISQSIYHISEHDWINKIIVVTRSGFTARIISRFRPRKQVIAVTPSESVARQLGILWGVHPVRFEDAKISGIPEITGFLAEKNLLEKEDVAIFTGTLDSAKHACNYISIHKVRDILETKKSG